MKRNHKIIAGLIIAAGISGAAIAQGRAGCDGMGPMGNGPMGGPGGQMGRQASMKFDPAARAEQRLDMFKGQLNLTKDQEPLWQAFAEKAKAEAGKGMQTMRAQPADEKLTAPERMAKMQAMMQGRLTAMTSINESFNRLYAVLTPEQKATADQHAARMGPGMGGRGGRPGPGMGGPGRGIPPQS
jgi:Spy/CpxP family protein refolding chaperone